MKEKRRDSKGRILHTGESQRTDGKYLYKYVDAFGNTKYVYAWRLTPTDPTPKEKREKPSLRELEQQIRRDIEDGIDSTGKKMTLCQLYAKQNLQRANVKKSTQKQREQLMRLLKEDKLGARSIDTIKPSDAKEWALRMKDKGFSYNTINNHKRSLKASFYIPSGKVTLLQGDPGDGKSKLMLSIAALLSKGEALPFTEEEIEPMTDASGVERKNDTMTLWINTCCLP